MKPVRRRANSAYSSTRACEIGTVGALPPRKLPGIVLGAEPEIRGVRCGGGHGSDAMDDLTPSDRAEKHNALHVTPKGVREVLPQLLGRREACEHQVAACGDYRPQA